MKQTDMNPNAKLSFLERFAFGTGDYAANLVYSAISAFLLVYYTNVAGVSAAVAASVIASSKILDGVTDLAMGYIVDHTHSKWGKARPWILRLCVPLAVCTVLMFSVPAGLEGKAKIAYMFLTYNLVSTIFYTGINVPYATLNGLMTTNQYERGLLGNFRMLLATAGTMTINTVVLKMTAAFGNGDSYTQHGWTITISILMVLFVIINIFVFAMCKERVTEQKTEEKGEKVSFIKGLVGLFKNKYWVLIVCCLFSMYFMMSCFYGSAVYFTKYNLGNEGYYATVSNLVSLSQIITMFTTPFIMRKVSKRNVFLLGFAISLVGFGVTGMTVNYSVICVLSVIKGIGFGCIGATMHGCLQDAITYGEWYNGYGTAGMGNAASSFCTKIGSGIGTAALGWVLSAGGFDSTAATQSAASLNAITWSFSWIPVIATIVSMVCLVFYDLDKKYDQAVADLAAGKHRGDQ